MSPHPEDGWVESHWEGGEKWIGIPGDLGLPEETVTLRCSRKGRVGAEEELFAFGPLKVRLKRQLVRDR